MQFRQIEWISGLRDTFPTDAEPPPGPSLYEAFVACAGLPEDPEARLEALADLYRDHDGRPDARAGCTASPSGSSTTTRASRSGATTTC